MASPHTDPTNEPSGRTLIVMRVYSLVGMVLLAIGVIGIWIPILPTTIFLIGAAACFARSSPRLYAYLMGHPRFSTVLHDWFEEGAISKKGKAAALWGMGLGMVLIVLVTRDILWISAGAIVLLASGWYVMARPLPSRERKQDALEAAWFRKHTADED